MARTRPRVCPLDQHPYINIFRLTSFDPERNLLLKGDVRQVTDPEIHRRVWNVKGDIPVNNSLTFPKEGIMQLSGRFLYILARSRGKSYFIHIEVSADRGPSVRLSLSNTYKETSDDPSGSKAITCIKLKTPDLRRWGVVAIDVEHILSARLPNRLFRSIKSINICASIAVRAVISSGLIFKEDTLPQESCLPISDGSKEWSDLYDWIWFHKPDSNDPAMYAEKPRNPLLQSVRHSSPNRSHISVGSARHDARNDSTQLLADKPPHQVMDLQRVQHANSNSNILMGRGSKILIWSSGRTIIQQNIDTGTQRYFIGHKAPVCTLFSDSNRRLLGSLQRSPPQIRLWDLVEERQVGNALPLKDYFSEVTTASMADELHTLLVAGVNEKRMSELVLFDCSVPSRLKVSIKHTSTTDSAAITQAVFVPIPSPDTYTFCSCDGSSLIRFWRVKNDQLRSFSYCDKMHSHHFTHLAFDPDLKRHSNASIILYVGSHEGYVHLMNYEATTTLRVVQVHYNPITDISISGGVCSTSDSEGFYKVWPLDLANSHIEDKLDSSITSICQSRTGLHTACLTDKGKISVIDFSLRSMTTVIDSHENSITSCVHHDHRSLLATASLDGSIRIWDDGPLEPCTVRFDCTLLPSLFGKDNALNISTVVGGSSHTNLFSGQSSKTKSKTDKTPLCLAWSRDANSAVLGCGYSKGSVRIFDVDHRCVITSYSYHDHDVLQILYTSNRKWLATMDCAKICFADIRHSYHVSRVVRFTELLRNVKLKESVNGEVLGAIAANESKVMLFNCEYGLELGYIQDHEPDATSACCITNIAFGNDDLLLAATSEGHVIQWRLPSPMPPPPPIEDTDFGVSSPILPATKISKSGAGQFGGSVLEISPQQNFVLSNHATKSNTISISEFPLHEGAQTPEVIESYSYPHSCSFTQAVWTPGSKTLITCDVGGCMAIWNFNDRVSQPVTATSFNETANFDIPHTIAESTGGVCCRKFNDRPLPTGAFPETARIPAADAEEIGLSLCGSLLRNTETVESALRGESLTFSVCGGVISSPEHVLINNGFVTTMSLSHDGNFIAAGVHHRTDPARIIIWDLQTISCTEVFPLRESRYVQHISWCSSDEKILVVCQDRFLVFSILTHSVVYESGKVNGSITQGMFFDIASNTVVACTDAGLLVDQIHLSHSIIHPTIALQCLTTAHFVDPNTGTTHSELLVTGGCDGYLLLWSIKQQSVKPARVIAKHQPASELIASITGISFIANHNVVVCTTQHGVFVIIKIGTEGSDRFYFRTLQEVTLQGTCSRTSPIVRRVQGVWQATVFTDGGGTTEFEILLFPEFVVSSKLVAPDVASSIFNPKNEFFLSDTENMVAVATSNGFLGVWHRKSSKLLASVNDVFSMTSAPSPHKRGFITKLLAHEKLGFVFSDSNGYVQIVALTDAEIGLELRHKFHVSPQPVNDITWMGDSTSAVILACDTKHTIIKLCCGSLLNAQRSGSGPIIECDVMLQSAKPHQVNESHSGVLKQAALDPSLLLYRNDQIIDVIEVQEDGRLSVLLTFVPPKQCFDADLTPCGTQVVYLVSSSLVFFDFRAIEITRTIDLHKPCFRSFQISRDAVFIALTTPSSNTITLCDFDYGTLQDIDGHTGTPTVCFFTYDCRNLYSVSTEGGTEIHKWSVKQLE